MFPKAIKLLLLSQNKCFDPHQITVAFVEPHEMFLFYQTKKFVSHKLNCYRVDKINIHDPLFCRVKSK